MSNTVTGKIANLSIQDKGTDKERHGVKVDGEWYNKFGKPDGYEEGDKVEIEYTTNQYGNQIEEIDVMESGASEDGSRREGDAKADNSSIGDKYTGSDTYIPPELQVAFKEACKDFRDTDEEMNMAEEEEFKSGKTAMHYEVLKKVGTENVGGDDQ